MIIKEEKLRWAPRGQCHPWPHSSGRALVGTVGTQGVLQSGHSQPRATSDTSLKRVMYVQGGALKLQNKHAWRACKSSYLQKACAESKKRKQHSEMENVHGFYLGPELPSVSLDRS